MPTYTTWPLMATACHVTLPCLIPSSGHYTSQVTYNIGSIQLFIAPRANHTINMVIIILASRPHCHHLLPFQLPGDLPRLPLLDLGGDLPRPPGRNLSSSPCSLASIAGPRALSSSEASYNTFIH